MLNKSYLTILMFLLFNNVFSQEFKLDYTNPVVVVNGLIKASNDKDLKLIFLVFDPFIEDGEFYKYRNVYFTKNLKHIQELHDIRQSYVNGPAIILDNGNEATVPMWYKSSVREYQEEIYLVKRYGNWYIRSF
jgi:hypothetical protein